MTDKLKTYEFRCRGTVEAESKKSARIALENVVVIATVNIAKSVESVYFKISSIELLGEVEGGDE